MLLPRKLDGDSFMGGTENALEDFAAVIDPQLDYLSVSPGNASIKQL